MTAIDPLSKSPLSPPPPKHTQHLADDVGDAVHHRLGGKVLGEFEGLLLPPSCVPGGSVLLGKPQGIDRQEGSSSDVVKSGPSLANHLLTAWRRPRALLTIPSGGDKIEEPGPDLAGGNQIRPRSGIAHVGLGRK